jgi:hypothetical protein
MHLLSESEEQINTSFSSELFKILSFFFFFFKPNKIKMLVGNFEMVLFN